MVKKVRYILLRAGVFVLGVLVRLCSLKVLKMLSHFIGLLMRTIMKRRIKIIDRNLKLVLPDWTSQKRDALKRNTLSNIFMLFVYTVIPWVLSRKKWGKPVICHGKNYLDFSIQSGRPVVIVSPHMITLEMAGFYLSTLIPNGRFTAIKRDLNNARMDKWVEQKRGRVFDTLSKHDTRGILNVMKKKEILYILSDQFYGARGSVRAKFLGHETGTVSTPAYFAKRMNAIIVPYAMIEEEGYYRAHFLPPVRTTGDLTADTTEVNRCLEILIHMNRSHYFWLHDRFKDIKSEPESIQQ